MRRTYIRLLVCLAGTAFAAWPQEFRATLTGIVTDAQGAVVPNVKVVATHVETGSNFRSVSGPAGQYTLPFLNPGRYAVAAEADGFKKYLREDIQLSTNQRVSLEIRLEVGAVTDSITVSADATMLTTASGSIGQPITTKQVDNMPMSGRAPMALSVLAFGVTASANPQANSRPFDNEGTARFSMGGGQTLGNELLLDGGPSMSQNRRAGYNPPLDSVQEVKIEVFQSDAAYGNTSGGTINIVTKGGSNQLHGSLGEFNQVSALAATNFFTNRAGGKKLVTRYNQWGVTSSGPVVVPKLYNGKNRLFWYFAYEGVRHTVPQAITATVPTAAERQGDFSALLPLGAIYQLYDPLTTVAEGSRRRRQPFSGNLIPAGRLNSIAKNYLTYYPLPNQAGLANGQNNFLANTLRNDKYFDVLGRLDFVTERHKLFWNIHMTDRTELINQLFANIAQGDVRPRATQGSQLDHVYTVTPTTLLNTRVSYNRFHERTMVQSDGFDFSALGFSKDLVARSLRPVMPFLSFNDGYQSLGASAGTGYRTPFDTVQLFSALSRVMGRHSLKAGADLRRQRESSINYGNSAGRYNFDTNWVRGPLDNSSSAPIGQSLASFLLGLPTGGGFDINGSRTNQAYYTAFFLQDDWRINSQLTLNLGLRYERETGTFERYNRTLAGFDYSSPNAVTQAARAAYALNPITEVPAAQFNPAGGPIFATPDHRNIYSTDNNAFSPRFGFAYTPGWLKSKTVFRGGFGIFFYTWGTRGVYQPGFSQTTPFVPTNDGYLTPYATLGNPYPAGILNPPGASGGINTYLGQGITFFNPAVAQPYAERGTLTIQRELRTNLVLEVGYLGTRVLHLPVSQSLNYTPARFLSTSPVRDQAVINRLTSNVSNPFQNLLPGSSYNGSTIGLEQFLRPFPQLSGLTKDAVTEGSTIFHALEMRLEKRLSHGLQFLTSFSWSKMFEQLSRLNSSDAFLEKRISDEDRPYRLVVSGSYDLPFGKGKPIGGSTGPWLNRLVGGWVASGIYTRQGGAALNWGNLLYYGGPLNLNTRAIDNVFDTTRFNTVSSQQLGSNIRTFSSRFGNLRDDRIENLDLSLIKNTVVTERLALQFRAESFNSQNRTQFSAPSLSATSASFGRSTGQANFPRVVQLALRLVW